MKKFVFALVCTFAMIGCVAAEVFNATIAKVDGSTVTFKKKAPGGPYYERSALAADSIRVAKGLISKGDKGNEIKLGDPIEGRLKNEIFTKIGDKQLPAQITTNDDGQITQILILSIGTAKKGD